MSLSRWRAILLGRILCNEIDGFRKIDTYLGHVLTDQKMNQKKSAHGNLIKAMCEQSWLHNHQLMITIVNACMA